MSECTPFKGRVLEAIEERRGSIVEIGESIMDAPELGFKEHGTADRVKAVFEELGLPFDEGLAITGVKA